MRKNKEDARLLERMIAEQNARGAKLPEDMDDARYTWTADGVSGEARLTAVNFVECGLTGELDLSGFSALKRVGCSRNALEKLHTSVNPSLSDLVCFGNRITEMDLTGAPELRKLDCSMNQMKTLDVRWNDGLLSLSCTDNPLELLNVSGLEKLMFLDCCQCGLTQLDVSRNPALKDLYCYGNPIETLDIRNNPVLEDLYHSCDIILCAGRNRMPNAEFYEPEEEMDYEK